MSLKRITRLALPAAFALLAAAFMATASRAGEVKMQFFGNQHFRFVSTQGKVILINPWIKGNRDFPPQDRFL